MIRRSALILVACLPAFADFSYQETSKVTGGMMAGVMKFAGAFSKQAREPIVSTVAVQGNRMLHGSQHHASIVDLDKETITSIDFDKKQYSVMTFAQMKQMMDQMSQNMKSSPDAQKANMQFKVSVKDTGEKKNIAGYDAREMILSFEMEGTDEQSGNKGGLVTTADMWLAPKVSGYDEIVSFRKRMAEKLDWTPGGSMGMMGSRPDMQKGMAELMKEGSKLNGMPVFQTVKMGVHAEGQQQGGQPAAQQQQQQQDKPSIGSILGGFGRKKKSQDEQSSESGAPQQGSGDASGSLMEMTTEMSGFSSAAVDPSKFEIPAGFKQVEAETQRRRR